MKLEQYLNPALYGQGQAKSWQALHDEIANGECTIAWQDGRPVRTLRVAVLDVRSPYGERLIEDRQEFTDGRTRRRNLDGLAEKMKPDESPYDAAIRALAEELNIRNVAVRLVGEAMDQRESPSYPGLLSQYHRFCFRADIPVTAYRTEYVEVQADKRTFFRWELMAESS